MKPDARDHITAICDTTTRGGQFNNTLYRKLRYIIGFIERHRPAELTLYAKDYDHIAKGLKGSGFDLSSGFLIDGVPILRGE